MAEGWDGLTVHTIGHSDRSLGDLLALLAGAGIEVLADIRTTPRSRRNPQFDAATLPGALESAGLAYAAIPELGGRRRARPDSPNTAWRNASFRGYADHMGTAEFADGLAALRARAAGARVAIMCAEAVPWRCHRFLVSDALTVRGAEVLHVVGPGAPRPHRLPAFARVVGTDIVYDGPTDPPSGG